MAGTSPLGAHSVPEATYRVHAVQDSLDEPSGRLTEALVRHRCPQERSSHLKGVGAK